MYIKLENLRVHYKVNGNGEPVILLHGWGRDLEYFAKLREYLADKFTVYALDLPGFGLSIAPERVWGSAEYANLVKAFIDELKIVNPILVGHSWGGKIAVHVAASGLLPIKKMILIGSSGMRLAKTLKVSIRIYWFKLLKFLAKLPIIKTIFAAKMELYRKKFGSQDYQNARGIMRAILVKTINEDVATLLPQVKVPTLLLWGDQDHETPLEAGKMMQQMILNAQLKIIPHSGHFPFLDNWERVKIELDNFLYSTVINS